MSKALPIVLTISGHDPSGGAGIQADIETLLSLGCRPCSVVTALTEQDTGNVKKLIPQRAEEVISQVRTLLADLPPAAVKIGLIGSADIAVALKQVLTDHPAVPVVLDPVLSAGGGAVLADTALIEAIRTELLPLTCVLTPNSLEARRVAPGNLPDLDACGRALSNLCSGYVLITGTHEEGDEVVNTLYHGGEQIKSFRWPRLPHSYHGSGCTLASSIAAMLAKGIDPISAVEAAQEFTWNSLKAGFRPGKGQYLPDRFFRMRTR